MDSGARVQVWVTLDEGEWFRRSTPTGVIMVRQVRKSSPEWSGTVGQVSIRGWAIKKDGTTASFQRDGMMSVKDLPEEVMHALRGAWSQAVDLASPGSRVSDDGR